MEQWKAHFKDGEHDADVIIENNFSEDNILHSLRMVVNDTAFTGMEFADFELANDEGFLKGEGFNIFTWGKKPNYHRLLQRYSLSLEIPTQVINIKSGTDENAILRISYSLEEDTKKTSSCRTMLDDVRVYPDIIRCHEFSLSINQEKYECESPSPEFEFSLLQICKKIKDKYLLKCCFGCLYSDYSPYGNGYFATMLCFESRGAKYEKVTTKNALWDIYDDNVQVQETHHCERFRPRINTSGGYRGLIY